jgi:hypothetical protein
MCDSSPHVLSFERLQGFGKLGGSVLKTPVSNKTLPNPTSEAMLPSAIVDCERLAALRTAMVRV